MRRAHGARRFGPQHRPRAPVHHVPGAGHIPAGVGEGGAAERLGAGDAGEAAYGLARAAGGGAVAPACGGDVPERITGGECHTGYAHQAAGVDAAAGAADPAAGVAVVDAGAHHLDDADQPAGFLKAGDVAGGVGVGQAGAIQVPHQPADHTAPASDGATGAGGGDGAAGKADQATDVGPAADGAGSPGPVDGAGALSH
ncbi:hypothetical protein AZA_72984 [Nitrospirillum viridazoti Y2]|nr:hypothetical protein AZA_72984 [Nitrospirillum amazonense Y2]